ncbi:uncharacterized protein N0V89_010398 [Didymosphaeria variabile]|uniref:CCHC-type domain-containing protein n=1 Tax=Didymosphaeria variabile TaxID=1932322 RepID=A0A9W8XCQ1_9PLEO|nr:uncharacterized protein N0V89_010398 [Didymosphaeria variabile]KAJ4346469.1 hypothetical protein N0V89_010398 [Didymosphaeria variabile]
MGPRKSKYKHIPSTRPPPTYEDSFSDEESILTPPSDPALSQPLSETPNGFKEYPTCLKCDMPGHYSRDCHKQSASSKPEVYCSFCGQQGVTSKDCCLRMPQLKMKRRSRKNKSKRPAAVDLTQDKKVESLGSEQIKTATAEKAATINPAVFRPLRPSDFHYQPFYQSDNGSEQANMNVNNGESSLTQKTVETAVKLRVPAFLHGLVDSPSSRDPNKATMSSDKPSSHTGHLEVQKDQDKSPADTHKALSDHLPWELTLAEWKRKENVARLRKQSEKMGFQFAGEGADNIVSSPTTNSTDTSKATAASDTFSPSEGWPGGLELRKDHFRRPVGKDALRSKKFLHQMLNLGDATSEADATILPADDAIVEDISYGNEYYCGRHQHRGSQPCPDCRKLMEARKAALAQPEGLESHMNRKGHRKIMEARKAALARPNITWNGEHWATTPWGAYDYAQNFNQAGHDAGSSSDVVGNHKDNVSSSDDATAAHETVRNWACSGEHWGNCCTSAGDKKCDPGECACCAISQRPSKPEPLQNPSAASVSTDSQDDISKCQTWPVMDPPPVPWSRLLDNEPPRVPVRHDLVVTYWITVESGEQEMHIPIEPEQVAGPEKDIINTGMKDVWQWVQDKGLGDKVSLQDAFDLAHKMHGGATKTGGGGDKKHDSATHSNNGNQASCDPWAQGQRSNNPFGEVSPRASTEKEDFANLISHWDAYIEKHASDRSITSASAADDGGGKKDDGGGWGPDGGGWRDASAWGA